MDERSTILNYICTFNYCMIARDGLLVFVLLYFYFFSGGGGIDSFELCVEYTAVDLGVLYQI